jgi:hypothetical protein
MPPEEANCLVAMRMDLHDEEAMISGVRVFATGSENVATITWYTATVDSPPGYESVLDGLVFVRSSTIGSIVTIDRIAPTKIDSMYHWNDNAHPGGLMIALCLPQSYTLKARHPQVEEAKLFKDYVAVYWYLRPQSPMDSRVKVSFAIEATRLPAEKEVERLNRAIVLSRARPSTMHYDVALSFAGEDRQYVHRVAKALLDKGVKVFYDKFEVADLWGKDLYSHLADVYGNQARFTVMFISAAYAAKLWTTHERKAAQAKAFTQNSEYILPVRFDETEVPGLLPTTGYVSAKQIPPAKLASLIIEKLMSTQAV